MRRTPGRGLANLRRGSFKGSGKSDSVIVGRDSGEISEARMLTPDTGASLLSAGITRIPAPGGEVPSGLEECRTGAIRLSSKSAL